MRGHIVRAGEAPLRSLSGGLGTSTQFVDSSIGSSAVDVRVNRLVPGGEGSYHMHPMSENIYYLLSGSLVLRLDGIDHVLQSGDVAFIPPGVPHSPRNDGDDEAVLLEVYAPTPVEFVQVPNADADTAG